MALFVGIDLGSTTSKAVVLDASEKLLGRGLTNTRSNYDVAATIARLEALDDARFTLLDRELAAAGPGAAALTTPLRRAWVVSHCVDRLWALGLRVEALAEANGSAADAAAIHGIFGRIEADADQVFGPLAEDRSRFFRDLASARFFADATAAAQDRALAYDVAAAAYDQAIVEVENSEEPIDAHVRLERALFRAKLDASGRAQLERAWLGLDGEALRVERYVGTGYGRQRLPFPKEQIRSEILCHGLGAHALYPATRTVLDIGGQDTKAIQLDGSGLVQNFQMNDRCAAGCGRYLGYIAEEMNLGLHELGPLALSATRAVKISSTCTVFAGVELRELLSLGERRENILLGLHRAILLRAMSLLSRSGGVHEELTFTGGVAKNVAVVRELKSLVAEHYGQRTINIHPDSIYTGALGAALFARRGGGESLPAPARGKRAPVAASAGGPSHA